MLSINAPQAVGKDAPAFTVGGLPLRPLALFRFLRSKGAVGRELCKDRLPGFRERDFLSPRAVVLFLLLPGWGQYGQ